MNLNERAWSFGRPLDLFEAMAFDTAYTPLPAPAPPSDEELARRESHRLAGARFREKRRPKSKRYVAHLRAARRRAQKASTLARMAKKGAGK